MKVVIGTESKDKINVIQIVYAQYLLRFGNLGYREKSLGVVIDKDNNFLILQLVGYGENDWNFSGGGIEEGETPEEALMRELFEELGTDKFKILKKSKEKIKYDWPPFTIIKRLKKEGRTYRGQSQNIFLVKFIGEKKEIKPDPGEIRQVKWVNLKDLSNYLNFPDQKEIYGRIIKELLAKK